MKSKSKKESVKPKSKKESVKPKPKKESVKLKPKKEPVKPKPKKEPVKPKSKKQKINTVSNIPIKQLTNNIIFERPVVDDVQLNEEQYSKKLNLLVSKIKNKSLTESENKITLGWK